MAKLDAPEKDQSVASGDGPVLNEWAVGQSLVICLDRLGEGMATLVLVHGAWHGAGDQYSATGTKQRTARPPNTSANQTTPLPVGLPYWRTTASSGTSYHSPLKRTQ